MERKTVKTKTKGVEGGRKEFKKTRTRLPVRSSKEVDTRKAHKQLMNSNKYNHIDATRMMSSSTQHFLPNKITMWERDRNLVYKIYALELLRLMKIRRCRAMDLHAMVRDAGIYENSCALCTL